MYDTMHTSPYCVSGVNCGSTLAPVFFILFNILVSQVMLNLFILVILQQFEKYYLDDDGPLKRFKADLTVFVESWCDATEKYHCIKIKENKQFSQFMQRLPKTLRSRDKNDELPGQEESIDKIMLKMGIRSHNGFIYFNELLYRLMRYKYLTFDLNTNMIIKELVMQYRLYELTYQTMNSSKATPETFLADYDKGGNKNSVNPFLTQMFLRASFSAWHTAYKRKRKMELRKLNELDDRKFMDAMQKEQMDHREELDDIEVEIVKVAREWEYEVTDSD
jgi:hypothetical protein